MSGWWDGASWLRRLGPRDLEAEARLAEEQRLGVLGDACSRWMRRAQAPRIPRTVSPALLARPIDLAAMARVEGWAPR